MRFLLDQDVYAVTARLLEELGHDIVLAGKLGLAQAGDEALLEGLVPYWLFPLPDTLVRTITENCRTLGCKTFEFEKE